MRREHTCRHCGELYMWDDEAPPSQHHDGDGCELKTLRSKLKAADEAWHEQEDELQSLRSRLDSYEKTIRHVLFHWDHTLPADAYRRLLTITRDYGEADAPEPAVVERHQP